MQLKQKTLCIHGSQLCAAAATVRRREPHRPVQARYPGSVSSAVAACCLPKVCPEASMPGCKASSSLTAAVLRALPHNKELQRACPDYSQVHSNSTSPSPIPQIPKFTQRPYIKPSGVCSLDFQTFLFQGLGFLWES